MPVRALAPLLALLALLALALLPAAAATPSPRALHSLSRNSAGRRVRGPADEAALRRAGRTLRAAARARRAEGAPG